MLKSFFCFACKWAIIAQSAQMRPTYIDAIEANRVRFDPDPQVIGSIPSGNIEFIKKTNVHLSHDEPDEIHV